MQEEWHCNLHLVLNDDDDDDGVDDGDDDNGDDDYDDDDDDDVEQMQEEQGCNLHSVLNDQSQDAVHGIIGALPPHLSVSMVLCCFFVFVILFCFYNTEIWHCASSSICFYDALLFLWYSSVYVILFCFYLTVQSKFGNVLPHLFL